MRQCGFVAMWLHDDVPSGYVAVWLFWTLCDSLLLVFILCHCIFIVFWAPGTATDQPGSIFIKNTKWNFGNMGSISIKKPEMEIRCWERDQYRPKNAKWKFGSCQLKELWHLKVIFYFQVKEWNIWICFSINGIHPPIHIPIPTPCTSPPLWGHEWAKVLMEGPISCSIFSLAI